MKLDLASVNGVRPTVILRRLANPYLPPNDPTDPTPGAYDSTKPANPYLTVERAATGVDRRGDPPGRIR